MKPFRNRIVLATKLHLNKSEGDTAAVIRNHLEASLKRLGTDYVDLYYQHSIEDNDRVEQRCVTSTGKEIFEHVQRFAESSGTCKKFTLPQLFNSSEIIRVLST